MLERRPETARERSETSDETALAALREYFLSFLPKVLRPAEGLLKHPYLVPGGTYAGQLWDWDSFWMNRGLMALKADAGAELSQRILDAGTGSWLNFFDHQAADGTLPILLKPEDADFFGCTRLDGPETNQAKPIFAQFALDLIDGGVPVGVFQPHLQALRKFHRHWEEKYGAANGLLTWGSDVAIGADNDPTTYGRPEFSSANLLLNCLYHADLRAAGELARRCADREIASENDRAADALGEAINVECWDERDGFFYTVDVQCSDLRDRYIPSEVPKGMGLGWKSLPLKIQTFTGFLPMATGIASAAQCSRLRSEHLDDPSSFDAAYGVRTLAANEKMYCPASETSNPSNWLGPIWIVANYMVWQALKNTDCHHEASQLARKTLDLLHRDLRESGTLHECYHPDTGAPNFNAGFMSWNVLALLMIP